ncbi:MAG TPA: glycosyltransferase family 4 protein [Burkholderiales bacterium]|nr:glycosyltransferase family 4 protein [Burkholderiales bacterium]
MNTPKILYFTPGCFDKGGISRYNRFQIRALREIAGEANVQVFSLLPRSKDDLEEPFDVAWAPVSSSHTLNKLDFSARVALRALRSKPDVIWVAHVYMSPLAVGLARMVKAKTVLNTYGLEVWSGLSPPRQRGLRACEEVIADCRFTARYLEDSGYRAPDSVKVIWDTVDVSRFTPGLPPRSVVEKYRIPDPAAHVNLLTLGRMSRGADHKGYRRLLEAFALAAPRVPELRLVYGGSGELVEVLRERAHALGFGDRVHFTGSVHEADLPDVYRCGHIFSLVSDRSTGRGEGVPVTPLEAAACALPILVGNQDGSPEAVEAGGNGYVLDSFDLPAHAEAIVELARSPESRSRMGAAGARRVNSEFSYNTFRDKHRAFLESLSSPPSSP